MQTLRERLLNSAEPSVRWLASGAVPNPALQGEIQKSARVQALLAGRSADGRIPRPAYSKWDGAHWVLSLLANLGCPHGDERLRPLAEQELEWLLGEKQRKKLVLEGRVRTCASMEGNGLFALCALGLADERAAQLAAGLVRWQWPDGGWNCDRRPQASHSSFHETLLPLRGLAAWVATSGDPAAARAVERAAEFFLQRRLFRRLSGGQVVDPEFLRLHYPSYWHYDVLGALQVLAEIGCLPDPRCAEALDWLESMRLPDGGFPRQRAYEYVQRESEPGKHASQRSPVDWGGVSQRRSNEWVSAVALSVLAEAGRVTD